MVRLIEDVTAECFVPVTVGGGIRSREDADALFRAGADKVAINTAALARPELITDIAERYGVQAVVIHVEAKQSSTSGWECYTEAGRQPTGVEVLDWSRRAQDMGAGELLITNVDRDGTRKGVDVSLLKELRRAVTVPIIASSGIGSEQDLVNVFSSVDIDGVAIGAALHWGSLTLESCRTACLASAVPVRAVNIPGD
jgi:cyclase